MDESEQKLSQGLIYARKVISYEGNKVLGIYVSDQKIIKLKNRQIYGRGTVFTTLHFLCNL
jgi:hypothetical protein